MHSPRLVDSQFGYIELDPSGRYGRFKEILGKGAMKTVYRAFDEMDGTEVAWNQVKLNDVFRSPEDLHRLYSEVHLLHNLDHPSIMRFHAYWVDLHRTTFNFITEMFTSGTLRLYRNKYKRVSMRAVKNWARQILQGLAHLHSHDPPIIHRDLKCDNIFVNGHLGQVKIGDLGLATILRCSHHAHSVIGTPEFMAPELYEEDYDELVDIYSFGMCMLEMLTAEYPYSECSNPAQIYKKVTSGKLPGAFYRIEDVEAQRFIRKCLDTASKRPSAHQLLMDPFLASEEADEQLPVPDVEAMLHVPSFGDPDRCTDMTITGTLNPEDDTIFLKVQIAPKDNGQARNVYFPFDIYSDTVVDVAGEMVKELEISDWKPMEIAEMIEAEISALVPSWPWKGCGHEQHDQDDNTLVPPFCSLSSQYSNSSQASLPVLFTSCEEAATYHRSSNRMTSADPPEWIQVQEDYSNYEDATSQSSFNSYNLSYFSDHCENDTNSNTKIGELQAQVMVGKSIKGSRFSPQVSRTKKGNALGKTESVCSLNDNDNIKMARVRSLVDLRSQLLHRSLVEEINKRRLFKTVGAVENIGYLEPASEIGSGGR